MKRLRRLLRWHPLKHEVREALQELQRFKRRREQAGAGDDDGEKPAQPDVVLAEWVKGGGR